MSSNSGSWMGGLFSPKFTTISANTAAKSASLSFAQMQSFSGSFSSGASNPYSSGRYDFEASYEERLRRRRRGESTSSSDRDHAPKSSDFAAASTNVHAQLDDSMSIPYNSVAAAAASEHVSSRKSSLLGLAATTTSNTLANSASGTSPHQQQSYSSSSGCSTQSSASSASNSLSTHPSFTRASKARSSLREAAANFRDFVQHYERGLM